MTSYSAEFVGAALVAARKRRGAFGPTSGRCPAEWSLARRSVNTPAYPRRTPHGAPAPRGPRFPFYLPGRSESAPASRFWRSQNARTRRGRGGEFGPTSGRCPAESSPARRSANTPAYPRRTPHGAPAPRGPRFPFYLPGRSESAPASRFWRSQNARTRRGRGGEFGPTSGRCPAESSPARRSANTPAYPRRTPHGAPAPRGPRFPFYLPGRSESAPASRFWRSQNARTRRGRGGEFGPTSGRCPAEWSPVRRSASTPACLRRTRRAPPGNPARRTRP